MLTTSRLTEILARIPAVRVAVVGDFFLDRYWKVVPELDEPSIETGLTAYQIAECWGSAGAAGTVTNNLAAIGVGKIYAVGFRGQDGEGYELAGHLDRLGVDRTHLHETPLRMTPCYTKPLRDSVEMNRFDIKNRTPTPPPLEDAMMESIRAVAGAVDAIIVMDQVSEPNCGVLTDRVRACLIEMGRRRPSPLIYADSRERIGLYRDMIIKCNEREVMETLAVYDGTQPTLERMKGCGRMLAAKTGRAVFITLGQRGQLVIHPTDTGMRETHVPTLRVQGEIDICGAGDASSSACVSALCAGATFEEAAMVANLASSVTIRKIGQTGTATPREVTDAMNDFLTQTEPT